MAVTFDTVTSAFVASTGSSASFSHTVGSGSNRVAYVFAAVFNSGDLLAGGSCTFGGVSAGSPVHALTSGRILYVWRVIDPTPGANTVVVNATGTVAMHVHVVSASNIDQSTPNGAIVSSGGSTVTSPVSNTVTLSTGGTALDIVARDLASETLTPDGSQTALIDNFQQAGRTSRMSYKAGSGSTTMSWTLPSTGRTMHVVIPLNAAASDVTAPVLTSPDFVATGSTTGTASVSTDEGNGTLYCVVTTSSTSPSAAQIKAGQDHTGSAAVFAAGSGAGQAVSGTGTQNVSVTGLTASTTYYAHFVHDDAAANESNVATDATGDTTSAANAAPSWSGTPSAMSAKRGQALTPQDITSLVSDADLDTLSYSITGAPTGVTINSSTGVISGTPTAAPGVYACTVEADDGIASPVSSSSFNITVTQCVLALNSAGYEFGDGNDPATMSVVASTELQVAAYSLTEWPPASAIATATATTGTNGRLADLGDDDLSFGTTYRVIARNAADGNTWAWTMAAS